MTPVLTPEESAALRDDMRGPSEQPDSVHLGTGDRSARRKLPTLQLRLDVFTEHLRALLPKELRMPVTVTATPPELLGPKALTDHLPKWAVLAEMKWGELHTVGYLGLNYTLGYALIELAYGAPLSQVLEMTPATRTRLTEVERQTLAPVLQTLCKELEHVMPAAATQNAHTTVMSYPFQLDTGSADACILSSFEFSLGQQKAVIDVVLLSHVLEQLDEQRGASQADTAQMLAGHLGNTDVTVTVLLGSSQIALTQLMALKPDDMIWLERAQTDYLPVFVEEQVKFLARPIVRNGALAIEIAAGVP